MRCVRYFDANFPPGAFATAFHSIRIVLARCVHRRLKGRFFSPREIRASGASLSFSPARFLRRVVFFALGERRGKAISMLAELSLFFRQGAFRGVAPPPFYHRQVSSPALRDITVS